MLLVFFCVSSPSSARLSPRASFEYFPLPNIFPPKKKIPAVGGGKYSVTSGRLKLMCSGPFRGAQGHNSLHDCAGRGHIGWKRGEVVPETHHACPARSPEYTAHTASTADAAYTCTTCTAHKTYTASRTYTIYTADYAAYAAYSKLQVWGLGGLGAGIQSYRLGGWGGWGLGAPGPDGPMVLLRAPQAVRPSKAAYGGAAKSSSKTTSPRFQ